MKIISKKEKDYMDNLARICSKNYKPMKLK